MNAKTVVIAALLLSGYAQADTLSVAQPHSEHSAAMTLSSPDITAEASLHLAQVADAFGCNGKNRSPALTWKNVPKDAKSLVLTVYDPDAPTGSGFWHWNVYNIPVTATGLAQNAGNNAQLLPPSAKVLKNDAGNQGYIGACPPVGDAAHRYIFTLYALNTTLDLPENSSPAILGFSLNGKVLATAKLITYYGR